jgi:hypothetical protein
MRTANVLRRGETAVILALAQGCSTDEAGRAGGVTGRTVRRWMTDPTFAARVSEMRVQILDRAVGALVGASTEAVATLRELMRGSSSDNVRMRAALGILDAVVTMRESLELERRIAALEDAMKEGEQ